MTISREYGAAGLAVADGVAHLLDYELLTDDLPNTVATRLGVSPEEVAARAGQGRSFTERVLGSLGAATPEALAPSVPRLPGDFDESLQRELERAIRERAKRGDIVILGRNAGAILGKRTDVLRVFLWAARDWRAERIGEAFGITRAQAYADIERNDAFRRRLAKERYGIAWGEARFYELTLDVAHFGIEGTVALIASAVRTAGS